MANSTSGARDAAGAVLRNSEKPLAAFRQPVSEPETPAAIQLRLSEKGTLRKFLRERVKGIQRLLQGIGGTGNIVGRVGNEVGARAGNMLAQPQFPQREQGQVG